MLECSTGLLNVQLQIIKHSQLYLLNKNNLWFGKKWNVWISAINPITGTINDDASIMVSCLHVMLLDHPCTSCFLIIHSRSFKSDWFKNMAYILWVWYPCKSMRCVEFCKIHNMWCAQFFERCWVHEWRTLRQSPALKGTLGMMSWGGSFGKYHLGIQHSIYRNPVLELLEVPGVRSPLFELRPTRAGLARRDTGRFRKAISVAAHILPISPNFPGRFWPSRLKWISIFSI